MKFNFLFAFGVLALLLCAAYVFGVTDYLVDSQKIIKDNFVQIRLEVLKDADPFSEISIVTINGGKPDTVQISIAHLLEHSGSSIQIIQADSSRKDLLFGVDVLIPKTTLK
jgi:hypothetical protein